MELNHLRVFYEVAKAGRFTEAAQRLNVSQSALSRSVALLEESEGVKLLERSKKGVTLTQVGAEVFRHCEQLFHTVRRIEETCRGVQEVCEGPVHFATTDHILNYLLPQTLQSFHEAHPKVIPSVFVGTGDEVLERLLNTSCEFALSFSRVAAPQVEFEELREEAMALVVNAEVWKTTKAPNHAARLNKIVERVGYISSIGSHMQSRPSRVLRELFGYMPPVVFEVNVQESQKRICMAGGGIAYLARFMVEREIENGTLQEINVAKPHTFKLWLSSRMGREMSLGARTFLEHLRGAWSKSK
jgi:LysR family transcriptional regulator, cyn operon transcriptional activator